MRMEHSRIAMAELDVEDPLEWDDDGQAKTRRVQLALTRHEEHHQHAGANKVAVVCAMMGALGREQQRALRKEWEEREQAGGQGGAAPPQVRIYSEAAIVIVLDAVMPPPKGVKPADIDLAVQERAVGTSLPEGCMVLHGRARLNRASRRTAAGRAAAWGKGQGGTEGGGKGKGKGIDKGKGKGKGWGKGKGAGQGGVADALTVMVGFTEPIPVPIGATLRAVRYSTGEVITIMGAGPGVRVPMFRVPGMTFCGDLEPQGFYTRAVAAARREAKWAPDTKMGEQRLRAFMEEAEEMGSGPTCREAAQRYGRHGSAERALCAIPRRCMKQPCVGMGEGYRTRDALQTLQRTLGQRTMAIGRREAAAEAERAEAAAKASQQRFQELAAKHLEEDRLKRAREAQSLAEAKEAREVGELMAEVERAVGAWEAAEQEEAAAEERVKEAGAQVQAAERDYVRAVDEEKQLAKDYLEAETAELELGRELGEAQQEQQREALADRLVEAIASREAVGDKLGGAKGDVSYLEDVHMVRREEAEAKRGAWERAVGEARRAKEMAFAAEAAARAKLGPAIAAPVLAGEEALGEGSAGGGVAPGGEGEGVEEWQRLYKSQAAAARWELDKKHMVAEEFAGKYGDYYKNNADEVVARRMEAAVVAMVEAAAGAAATRAEAEEVKKAAEGAAKAAQKANKAAELAERMEGMMDNQLAKLRRSPAGPKTGGGAPAAAAEKRAAAAAGAGEGGGGRQGAKRRLEEAGGSEDAEAMQG